MRVHLAWQAHGPGTTRQVAQQAGISLLTLRPRTTDLHKLGLVEMSGADKGEGIYVYVPREQAATGGAWKTRADFSARVSPTRTAAGGRQGGENSGQTPAGEPAGTVTGFPTVEAAIASLPPTEAAALGARLMSQFGHYLKRRQPAAGQLSLAV